MLTIVDLLTLIEEQKTKNVQSLAKETDIPKEKLHTILTDLSQHNLIKYNEKTGEVKLSKWLLSISQKIEEGRPPTGEIVLPRFGEIKIQDMVIGNYTSKDLELKVRLRAKQKEIAICELT
ncbi:hypothetical protein KEJ24_01965 [Candidatus Bathyarchaeota archaeon]|nr:hypothetical protein [Candidatus Bathyarchaeota archaeon]